MLRHGPKLLPEIMLQRCNAFDNYRKIFNISRTKSQKLNDSSLVLLLSLPNQLKPGVKSRMKI